MPVPALAAGAVVLAKNPKVQQALKNVAQKIFAGLGKVSQDRFIERTDQVFDAFNAAGYEGKGTYRDFKIGKSQVPDHNDNYQDEFNRLHNYIVYRMNLNNPGLGDYWATIQPSLPLVNQGNISKTSLESFKELLTKFPPKTYMPGIGIELNVPVGAGQGQAYVGADGNIVVPIGQSGIGVNQSLLNLGADQLSQYISKGIGADIKIQPSVAASVQNSTPLQSGGGIVVTGTVSDQYEFKPVSDSGGSYQTTRTPGWVWIAVILGGVFLLGGGLIKKLLGIRR